MGPLRSLEKQHGIKRGREKMTFRFVEGRRFPERRRINPIIGRKLASGEAISGPASELYVNKGEQFRGLGTRRQA